MRKKDEIYILDLCDKILHHKSARQHRFPFLVGDAGRMLPVDAYYPKLKLAIEYHERQHSELVPIFDKRMTASGMNRGMQRRKYDRLREKMLPRRGITLVVIDYTKFAHNARRQLTRNRTEDRRILRDILKKFGR